MGTLFVIMAWIIINVAIELFIIKRKKQQKRQKRVVVRYYEKDVYDRKSA